MLMASNGQYSDAEATVHADIRVDVELGRLGDGATRFRVVGTHDPDTLRRTDLGADATGGATLFLRSIRLFIVNKERDIARLFGRDQSFFRILDGEDASRLCAGTVLDPFFSIVAFLAAQQPEMSSMYVSQNCFQVTLNPLRIPFPYIFSPLAIQLAHHNVDDTEQSDEICDLRAQANLLQRSDVDEGWSADMIAPGIWLAVRDHVKAKFTFRAIRCDHTLHPPGPGPDTAVSES